ncbi:hypothetical protein ROSMUCSMR3_02929 [Roseovarius mucosus]|uniref:Uncharacterized protein n=1 Tax=Roseovarius mucosus TaxID=215743 RepID=A0A1V0RRX7_9RHOB|nr:hypothetical protein ROSMUCSMR3_02929 [Roseovarius mucosus]
MVTAELEARWNRMLQRVQEIEQKLYQAFIQSLLCGFPFDMLKRRINLELICQLFKCRN